MGYHVDNAVIMAAGTSSRFAPLSYERPKALIEVKGEILIERQIRQLREAGIDNIIIVVGYMKEQFAYLAEKYHVILVDNEEYKIRNNNGSIYAARDYLKNSYVCSSDNYFTNNPFENEVDDAYYAALYSEGKTSEWCLSMDAEGYIKGISIGGENAWYMLGHTFWNEEFSRNFIRILERIYNDPETAGKLWERIYMDYICELKMKIRKYSDDDIFEFDTLDELRKFDASYISDTRSVILKKICGELNCKESEITEVVTRKAVDNEAIGFRFALDKKRYSYIYKTNTLRED